MARLQTFSLLGIEAVAMETELPKQAAPFDLPITLGVLAASGQLASELFERLWLFTHLPVNPMILIVPPSDRKAGQN